MALRDKGNESFRSAKAAGISPALKLARIDDAIRLYNQSLASESRTADDCASCHKNLGTAYCRRFETLVEMRDPRDRSVRLVNVLEQDQRDATFALDKSVQHAMLALAWGTSARKPQEWLAQVASSLLQLVDQIERMSLEEDDSDARTRWLKKLAASFRSARNAGLPSFASYVRPEAEAEAHLRLARALFNSGVEVLGDERGPEHAWRVLFFLDALDEAERPLAEARAAAEAAGDAGARARLLGEIGDLRADATLHRAGCESVREALAGDALLKHATADFESLPFNLLWDAADAYKRAMTRAAGADVEAEAEATVRLGRLYARGLCMQERAHEYYFRAVQLAQSLFPGKAIHRRAWYVEAQEAVTAYRERKAAEEERERAADREPILRELAAELEALEAAAKRGSEARPSTQGRARPSLTRTVRRRCCSTCTGRTPPRPRGRRWGTSPRRASSAPCCARSPTTTPTETPWLSTGASGTSSARRSPSCSTASTSFTSEARRVVVEEAHLQFAITCTVLHACSCIIVSPSLSMLSLLQAAAYMMSIFYWKQG